MRNVAFSALALLMALPAPASAQGPGSYAQMSGYYGGAVRLDANYYASDTCQAAFSAYRGAPDGQSVAQFVIPVTIVVGPNPVGCGTTRVVRRIMSLGASINTQLIQIFFVNPSGRILKIEKVAIETN